MNYFYFLFPNTDYKYNLITIIYPPMSISHSQQRAIIFQKDQVISNGCCFDVIHYKRIIQQHQNHFDQRYSQPKRKSQKKIDLTITKGRCSQPKLMNEHIAMFLQEKELGNTQTKIKSLESTGVITSLGSKISTQRNSLKNSIIKQQHKQLKIVRIKQKIKLPDSGNQNINQLAFHQTRQDLSNIQLLSEISIVEQQFLSHQSTTLNALNFLANFQLLDSKINEQCKNHGKYLSNLSNDGNKQHCRQTSNPLQRIVNRKHSIHKATHKQKLLL